MICVISQQTDLKSKEHVDTSSFALKTNLANLKTEFDFDKLAPFHVDMSKLSDVVKSGVVKKTVYDKLVAKINNIDASDFVLKTKYNTDKTELKKKKSWFDWFCLKGKTHLIRKQNSWC